jgi:hypothetical protein
MKAFPAEAAASAAAGRIPACVRIHCKTGGGCRNPVSSCPPPYLLPRRLQPTDLQLSGSSTAERGLLEAVNLAEAHRLISTTPNPLEASTLLRAG